MLLVWDRTGKQLALQIFWTAIPGHPSWHGQWQGTVGDAVQNISKGGSPLLLETACESEEMNQHIILHKYVESEWSPRLIYSSHLPMKEAHS